MTAPAYRAPTLFSKPLAAVDAGDVDELVRQQLSESDTLELKERLPTRKGDTDMWESARKIAERARWSIVSSSRRATIPALTYLMPEWVLAIAANALATAHALRLAAGVPATEYILEFEAFRDLARNRMLAHLTTSNVASGFGAF